MCSNSATKAMKQKSLRNSIKKRKVESLESTSEALKSDCNEIPLLYREDVGTEGVKLQHHSCSIMISGSERAFQVPITATEKKRRRERQARFGNASSAVDNQLDGVHASMLMAPKNGNYLEMSQSFSGTDGSKIYEEKPAATGTESSHTTAHDAFVGTNQNLEKPYLRLTTFPKAKDVRPLDVLVKALARIKSRYIQEEDFDWANEQLKSLRQDITVQGLCNKVVLDAYETHARILLEHGDLSEFNQCQTMIRTLATSGNNRGFVLGTNDDRETVAMNEGLDFKCHTALYTHARAPLCQSEEAADEFAAYGILYALVQHSNVVVELLRSLRLLGDVHEGRQLIYDGTKNFKHTTESSDQHIHHVSKVSSCRHALQVVKAVIHHDYRAFFRLYDSAPHLSAYLMDFLVKRVRDAAYERIVRAYRPTISVEYFREALYFPDLEETRVFLRSAGAVFVEEKGEPLFWIDCKASK